MGSAFCPVYGEKSKIRFKDEMVFSDGFRWMLKCTKALLASHQWGAPLCKITWNNRKLDKRSALLCSISSSTLFISLDVLFNDDALTKVDKFIVTSCLLFKADPIGGIWGRLLGYEDNKICKIWPGLIKGTLGYMTKSAIQYLFILFLWTHNLWLNI